MQLFRLLSATPSQDGESWRLNGPLIQNFWYEDAYGQNPLPFQQPRSGPSQSLPYPWQPGAEHAEASSITDAVYGTNASFSLDVDTSSYPAQLSMSGVHPVNAVTPGDPPVLLPQASTSNTGGSILPGTYTLSMSLSVSGPVSHLTSVVVPTGTTTNSIIVTGIRWPNDGIHHTSAILYIGTSVLNMQSLSFAGVGWAGSSPDSNGNPTVATVTTLPGGGTGQPDSLFRDYLVQEYPLQHGGVWGDSVTSVVSTTGQQVLTFAGSGGAWTTNQWVGRLLSLYYRPGIRQPIVNYTVSASTGSTLTVTGMLPGGGFQADDVVVMRAKAAHITATTIGDDNFINSYAPSGLDTSGTEKGRLIQIIGGTGAVQPAKSILSNTSTVFTIAQPWDITPNSTSIFIVIEPTVAYEYTTAQVTNNGGYANSAVVAKTPAINAKTQSLLIQIATVAADGNYFPMRYQPFREVYIPPQNTGTDPGYYTITPSGGNAVFDIANGTPGPSFQQKLILGSSAVAVQPPIWTGGSIALGMPSITLYCVMPASGTIVLPTFSNAAGGFPSNIGTIIQWDSTFGTRTSLTFSLHDNGMWLLDSQQTGVSLT